MSALNFSRHVLECDGCKKRHGEPHGHNSPREARIAAYIDGWRYPLMLKADDSYGTTTSDVCPDCLPGWIPQRVKQRNVGRRLSVDEAPTAAPETATR